MKSKARQGFTLIELMIVVAIIGILAAIAIPKFADLINKSKEGATKGALSSVRSALQVYYGDNEGWFPTDLAALTANAKYINEIPVAKLPTTGHADDRSVAIFSSATAAGVFQGGAGTQDTGGWAYFNSPANTAQWGTFVANCTHEDIKGQAAAESTPWTTF
ncbi:MAG: type II secretion system protein [Elusimicrobia bacterium]|jgi:general secretion pathway protein G|nr:type II secretion system protein [Elusimicrobiota bacterium]